MIYEIEYDRHELYDKEIIIFYFDNSQREIPLVINLEDYYANESKLLETPTFNKDREVADFDLLTYDEFVAELEDVFYQDHIKEMLTNKVKVPDNYSGLKIYGLNIKEQ